MAIVFVKISTTKISTSKANKKRKIRYIPFNNLLSNVHSSCGKSSSDDYNFRQIVIYSLRKSPFSANSSEKFCFMIRYKLIVPPDIVFLMFVIVACFGT